MEQEGRGGRKRKRRRRRRREGGGEVNRKEGRLACVYSVLSRAVMPQLLE